MERQAELAIVRRAYAKQILATARVRDTRIEAAFAAVPREIFLGAGPWQMMCWPRAYISTPDDDPILLYVDQVIALMPERGINNGQPSLHAVLIAAAQIKPGQHVVHVGAGSGYYTAIMAQLAGPAGKVTAFEYDPALASRARQCLSGNSNVRVIEGDGSIMPFDVADVIYVNAGVTHPVDSWLNGLREGGCLILPLTTDENVRALSSANFDPMKAMRSGIFFRIRRRGAIYEAHALLPTAIIPAVGARDEGSEAALAAALDKGGWDTVTRLVRSGSVPEEHCWLRGNGWCLAQGSSP